MLLRWTGTANYNEQPVTGFLNVWAPDSVMDVPTGTRLTLLRAVSGFVVDSNQLSSFADQTADRAAELAALGVMGLAAKFTNGEQLTLPSSWAVTNTAASPSVTSSAGQVASQIAGKTVRVSGTASAAGQYVRATGALPSPLVARGMEVAIPVFIPDYTQVQDVTISFSSDGYVAKQMLVSYQPEFSGLHYVGLCNYIIQGVTGGQQYSSIGGEVSDGTTFTHARLQLTLKNGASTEVFFGQPVYGSRGVSKIMISVDDGESLIMQRLDSTKPHSVFNYAVSKGIRLTHFLIHSLIGTPGYVTAADVKRMLDVGHQVCPHGLSSLASLPSDAARRADIAANISGLKSLGVPESMLMDCYAYPNGVFETAPGDTSIMQILRDFGFKMARTAARRAFVPLDAGVHRQYHIPILGHYTDIGGGGETEAATLQHIDDLNACGAFGALTWHKFSLGVPTDTLQTKYSTALAILDKVQAYSAGGSMRAVTPSDLCRDYKIAVPISNNP